MFFFLFGSAYERGFFCDDESLMHPFHESTVTSTYLYTFGFGIPLLTVVISEYFRWRLNMDQEREMKFYGHDIPFCVQNVYKYFGIFFFGAACSQLTTDIGKYTIGRLRPHFLSVCQPIMPDGTNCSDPKNFNRYIEVFTCGNMESSARKLKEMRLSFPSGHSSFSMYTMVFAVLYLHCRMNWKGSKLLKHFLQFAFISAAWYTALSRISDYKHHCKLLKVVQNQQSHHFSLPQGLMFSPDQSKDSLSASSSSSVCRTFSKPAKLHATCRPHDTS